NRRCVSVCTSQVMNRHSRGSGCPLAGDLDGIEQSQRPAVAGVGQGHSALKRRQSVARSIARESASELYGNITGPALAIGGLAMAAGLSNQSRLPSGTLEVMRRNVFIDTTLFHPALIRALVDLLGVDNVVAGSDWPITGDRPVRHTLL